VAEVLEVAEVLLVEEILVGLVSAVLREVVEVQQS
jgi:hypothetical protein